MTQQTKPQPLEAAALARLSTADLVKHTGDINTAYDDARRALRTAEENLKILLTEQITRHVLNNHPDAALVFVRAAAEYHTDPATGERHPNCPGHNARLVPFEVVSADGIVLGGFDPLSPVLYLAERLSPILGTDDLVLDVTTRDWAYDATND